MRKHTNKQITKMLGGYGTNEKDDPCSGPPRYEVGRFRNIEKIIKPEMLEGVILVRARPFDDGVPPFGVTEPKDVEDIWKISTNMRDAYLTYGCSSYIKNPEALSKIPMVILDYQEHVIRDAEEFPIFFKYLPAYDEGKIYIKPKEVLKSKPMLDFFTLLLQRISEVSDDFTSINRIPRKIDRQYKYIDYG